MERHRGHQRGSSPQARVTVGRRSNPKPAVVRRASHYKMLTRVDGGSPPSQHPGDPQEQARTAGD